MIKLFQDAITSFRDRLAWIYKTYFSADEQVGLNLSLRPDPSWPQTAMPLALIGLSMVGAVFTLIYLFPIKQSLKRCTLSWPTWLRPSVASGSSGPTILGHFFESDVRSGCFCGCFCAA